MTADRLIDAGERCLRRSGIRRTTMSEVAAEAGVSRTWLYRHFPDKPSLVVAVLGRVDERFWADAHAHVGAASGLAAQVAAAVELARSRPPSALVLELQEAEPEAFAATVGRGLRDSLPAMARFWHGYVAAARDAGELRADVDVPQAAEWVMRVVLSLVTIPGDTFQTDDPQALRAFLASFLVPGLRRG